MEVAEATEEAEEAAPPTPAPKRRGRPAGSKNKVKVEVVALEDPAEEEPEEPQPLLRQKKPRAPRKAPPEPPMPPIDTSILILNALREHQQQRAARKSAKYALWFA